VIPSRVSPLFSAVAMVAYGPDDPDRPVRLIDLWGKLPERTRRDTLTTLTRLVAQRLRAPRAEPEVSYEGR
jgi:hypothetical protein